MRDFWTKKTSFQEKRGNSPAFSAPRDHGWDVHTIDPVWVQGWGCFTSTPFMTLLQCQQFPFSTLQLTVNKLQQLWFLCPAHYSGLKYNWEGGGGCWWIKLGLLIHDIIIGAIFISIILINDNDYRKAPSGAARHPRTESHLFMVQNRRLMCVRWSTLEPVKWKSVFCKWLEVSQELFN